LVAGRGAVFIGGTDFLGVTDREELVEIEKQPESEIELQIQPEKVAATTYLGGLQEEVRPLELTTRLTASGLHEAEFRGTKFIQEQKNNSTIELFRVNDENIIKSFIKKQTDRSKLFYIRLSGEGQAEQYVMLYGSFGNKREAAQTLTALPFKFPETIQPVVVQFADYRPYVNDLGADEMGLSTKLYAVNLRPAAVPKIDESALARPPATTTTTQRLRRQLHRKIVPPALQLPAVIRRVMSLMYKNHKVVQHLLSQMHLNLKCAILLTNHKHFQYSFSSSRVIQIAT